jgi:hypothetical protein
LSAGHHARFTDTHRKELQRIYKMPWFRKAALIERRLFRKVEIPWLGGSSEDTRHIYVDHRFAGRTRYLAKLIEVAICIPAVIDHETIEAILLVFGVTADGGKYEYDGAHEIATCAEELRAERQFVAAGLKFDRQAYQDIFKTFLTITEKPPWNGLPSDLNTIPYREDDPSLYRELERQMMREQLARTA